MLSMNVPSNQPNQRVVIVYDRLNSAGGAERVLQALLRLYPKADLATAVYEPTKTGWINNRKVITTPLQRLPKPLRNHRWWGWAMPALFEQLDLHNYDLIISVTSEAAKAVLTQPHQTHVCYLLTPTRYLWSHADEYAKQIPWPLRLIWQSFLPVLRQWDRATAQRPDYLIPISETVGERVRKYYHREPLKPLYPTTPNYNKDHPSRRYVIGFGRHVAYKNFASLIIAAYRARLPLIIAGSGPQTPLLKLMAIYYNFWGGNIRLTGWVGHEQLAKLVGQAALAVFPNQEDFGIATLEAVRQGVPVIAHAQSGVTELLRPDQDGIFISDISIDKLVSAMRQAANRTWDRLDIRQHAQQYDEVHFARAWCSRMKELAL